MSYLNGTSKEKFIVHDIEDDILMGNGTDAGFIDVDYSVCVEASCEVIGKTFEDSAICGCSLNIIGNTVHNFENSCETILDSYQYKENNSQVLPEMKTEADPIMGDVHCVTVSSEKIFLLMMHWRTLVTWAYIIYFNKHHQILV